MAADKTYSDITLVLYNNHISSIVRLYEAETKEKFQFIDTFEHHVDTIMDIVCKKYTKTSVINYISAILWRLSMDNPTDADRVARISELYRAYGSRIKIEMLKEREGKENELTEREKKTFMKWEDILTIYGTMRDQLDRSDLDNISYDKFLDFVMVSLYVLQPPARVDYVNMKWFIADEFVPEGIKENYCVLQTNPRFVFQQYKTEREYGTVTVPICDELHQILIDWCYVNESDYLLARLVKSSNTLVPMKDNALIKRMGAIFVRHGGKPVNISTFRHSFVSYHSKHDQDLQRKQKHALYMMHTPDMADQYRRNVYK